MLQIFRKLCILPNQAVKSLRQRVFSISIEETTFAKRGFTGENAETQGRLEQIGCVFLQGYHLAIASDNFEVLLSELNAIETELRGFAFEGAAMGLALLDYLTPWKQNRIQVFLQEAAAHTYMVYVGIGWLLARIPLGMERYLTQLNKHPKFIDPLLGWLAVDGYGFHQGYFHPRRYIDLQVIPQRFSDRALRVFDQGLGRSLWFVNGADVTRIALAIAAFHPNRQADLWSGVGLACAYASGVNRPAIETLQTSAGLYLPHLAQGAAFAAKARQRAGNPAIHTEIACEVLCGMSAKAAAQITEMALENLPNDPVLSNYEVWRKRIQNQLSWGIGHGALGMGQGALGNSQ